jgi:hypothetical protein
LDVSEHHLIPRTTHRNKRVRAKFSVEEMKQRKVDSCQPCHKAVHTFWTEKELALEVNTVEKIKADPRMQVHIRWVRKQRPGHHMKGRRKHQKTKRF